MTKTTALRAAVYTLAFVLPPLMLGLVFTFSEISSVMMHSNPTPISTILPEPKKISEEKHSALILTGNTGTQVTDLMASYEVLSAAGFDVITAAPERRLSPTTGAVAFLPDYPIKEAPVTDVLVIPALMYNPEKDMLDWIGERAAKAKQVLILSDGARIAAQAGLLRGRKATGHFLALEDLRKLEPKAEWIGGVRVISDEKFVSSPGIYASIDAALIVAEKVAGRRAAAEARGNLQYNTVSSSGADNELNRIDLLRLFLRGGFGWGNQRIAVLMFDGASELSVASILDTHPRTLTANVYTVAPQRRFMISKHGLALVPSHSIAESDRPDLVLVPSALAAGNLPPPADPAADPEVKRWVTEQNLIVKSFLFDSSGASFGRNLDLLTQLFGEPELPGVKGPITGFVARMTNYPTTEWKDVKPEVSGGLPLWARALILGLFGLVIAVAVLESRLRRAK